MKNITVGFSKHPGSLLSWLIRAVTKSKVSHVYQVIVVEGEPMVYQASGLMVNYTALPVFLEKNVVIEQYSMTVTDEQYEKAKKLRVTQVGKPYSVKQLFGFFYVLGMRKLGEQVRNPLGNGNHAYVCCEIIADSLGITDGESMTPEDFRRYCERYGQRL